MDGLRLGKALLALIFALATSFALAVSARAQDTGPLAPPPPEHSVRRISTVAEPEAPPALPPEEIIQRFAKKEDEYLSSRGGFTYHKTLRIEEFGPDGKPAGQLTIVTEARHNSEGKVFEKVLEKPQSTLQYSHVVPEDLGTLLRMPLFPLTTAQLAKYDLKYIGKEQVDEIECYIFQVKAKVISRDQALFDGIVWVDTKYLEVVKTYGKWANDQGDMHLPAELPFTLFETYRENVDGKYWFPNYSRSDGTLQVNDLQIPMRIVIKWSDFKPFSAVAPAAPATPAPAPGTTPTTATPPAENKPQ